MITVQYIIGYDLHYFSCDDKLMVFNLSNCMNLDYEINEKVLRGNR